MMKTLQRGFTLIELLVVIAIIGILAAVVLTSLNDARSGANAASAKSSITSMRAEAEIFYNANGFSYAGWCDADAYNRLLGAATANGADNVDCVDSETEYAVEVQLPVDTNVFFCVDSSGNAGEQAASSISSVVPVDATCGG